MKDAPIIDSVESVAESIGALAADHMDVAFRAIASGPGVESTDHYLRYVTGEPHPMGNLALIEGTLAAEDLKDAAAPLLEGAIPSALLFPNGVGSGVEAAAGALGYQSGEMIPAMAADIAAITATSLPAGYVFKRVDCSDDDSWSAAFAAGYGLPPKTARLFSPGAVKADLAPDSANQFFAVVRDGRIVATSVLFLAAGLAGIYCVSTLAEERKKGLGAHATAEALRVARRLGYRVGVLQSSSEGHGVYLRIGFRDFGSIPMFVRVPA